MNKKEWIIVILAVIIVAALSSIITSSNKTCKGPQLSPMYCGTCPSGLTCSNNICQNQTLTNCTESWECGQWGICANNTQSRVCNDYSNCGTTKNRPSLNRSFDCSVKCTENDGGMNYNVKGTTTGLSFDPLTDNCVGNSLSEYYCGSNSSTSVYLSAFTCPYGCSNGACLANTTSCSPTTCSALGKKCGYWSNGCNATLNCGTCSPGSVCNIYGACRSPICSDSDAGVNYNLKGTVSYTDANGINGSMTDSCSGNSLSEYSCNVSTGANYIYNSYTCPYGCSNGACLANTTSTCTDSDGGTVYNVKGITSKGNISNTDFCSTNLYLLEYYCANNSIGSVQYKCTNCTLGRCV